MDSMNFSLHSKSYFVECAGSEDHCLLENIHHCRLINYQPAPLFVVKVIFYPLVIWMLHQKNYFVLSFNHHLKNL